MTQQKRLHTQSRYISLWSHVVLIGDDIYQEVSWDPNSIVCEYSLTKTISVIYLSPVTYSFNTQKVYRLVLEQKHFLLDGFNKQDLSQQTCFLLQYFGCQELMLIHVHERILYICDDIIIPSPWIKHGFLFLLLNCW